LLVGVADVDVVGVVAAVEDDAAAVVIVEFEEMLDHEVTYAVHPADVAH